MEPASASSSGMLATSRTDLPRTILEYLTWESPEINQIKLLDREKTNSNDNSWHKPQVLLEWKDFNLTTLRALYDGRLFEAMEEESSFGPLPHIAPEIDCQIRDKMAVSHILTKWNHAIVTRALCHMRKNFHPSFWVPGTQHRVSDAQNPRSSRQIKSSSRKKLDVGAICVCF